MFCARPLDLYNPYIEYKVKIETVFKGKSHLFVGLVDKTKYRPEFLGKQILIHIVYSVHVLERRAQLYVLGCVEHQTHSN